MRALIVDDSSTMRRIIANSLVRIVNGIIIDQAEHGMEAIEKYKDNKPDFICLDWNMPVMDGLEFIQWLRKQDTETPVIMITTEGGKHSVITALKSGVNQYMIKPFTPDVLLHKLSDLELI